MSRDNEELNMSLLKAVRRGNLRKVSELITLHGLPRSDDCLLLCKAIKFKCFKVAKFLVDKGAKVNCEEGEADAPLHLAARVGPLSLVETLINRDAAIDAQNKKKQTPLHIATQRGNEAIIRLLINKGADHTAVDSSGMEPLFIACNKGYHSIVKLLLKLTVPAQSLHAALLFASSHSNEEIVSTLLVAGANPNAVVGPVSKNLEGLTKSFAKSDLSPLFLACEGGHVEVAKLLLNHGAQINFQRPADSFNPLHIASGKGHGKVVELLLDSGADPNTKACGNVTPLHLAAEKKHLKIVKLLLEHSADVHAQNSKGLTPFNLAFLRVKTPSKIRSMFLKTHFVEKDESRKIAKIILALIDAGSDVNKPAKYNLTPLHLAVMNDDRNVVRALLENNANPNSVQDGMTPLHYAARAGMEDIVSDLIEAGADVNIIGRANSTPLSVSILSGYTGVVKILLKNKANVNSHRRNGQTPLYAAIRTGKPEIVSALIEAGADVNAVDRDGFNLLHMAALDNRPEIVKILLQSNANVNARHENGETPLHLAALRGAQENVSALIEGGADVNAFSQSRLSPLHLAAHGGHADVVSMLLANNANVNVGLTDDGTPLTIAVSGDQVEIVRILVEAGADVTYTDRNGLTLLHIAARKGQVEIVKLLLKNKPNINARLNINSNSTPLIAASSEGHFKVVEALLEFGADINMQARAKGTALHYAVMKHQYETVEILLNNGVDINIANRSGRTALDYTISDGQNDDPNQRRVTLLLMKFLLKLKIAGLPISESTLQSFHNHPLINDEELSRFQQDCEEEVGRLKSEKISDHLVLFDILINQRNPAYARNKPLMQTLKSFNYKKFPIYRIFIENNVKNIKKGERRFELLSAGTKSLATLLKVSNLFNRKKSSPLPAELLEAIVSYLSDAELERFTGLW